MKVFGDISPLQVQTISTFAGVDTRSLLNIDDSKSYLQMNMTVDAFPALKNRQGIMQLGSGIIAGLPRGIGAWKNSELNVIYNDGVWYKWTGSAWSSVTTGLDMDAYASFCNFQGNLSGIHLIMANGVDAVKKYDGTTVSNLANAPAGITYIDAHDNRVYGAKNNTIYYSALRKPEDWTTVDDAGSITVDTADGEIITGIRAGLQKLTVFKANSMYELFGTGPSNYRLVQVAENIGMMNHRSSTIVKGVMYFLHKGGVYRYSGGSRPDKSFCAPVQNIIDATANNASNTNYAVRSCIGDDGESVFVHLHGYNSVLNANNIVLQYHTLYDIWSIYAAMSYHPHDFENVNGKLYAACNFNVKTWKSGTNTDQETGNSAQTFTSTYISKAFSGPFLGSKNRFFRMFITHDTGNGLVATVLASTSSTSTFSSGWTTVGAYIGNGNGITTTKIMIPETIDLQNSNTIQFKIECTSGFTIYQIGFEYIGKPLV